MKVLRAAELTCRTGKQRGTLAYETKREGVLCLSCNREDQERIGLTFAYV
jgi:hypothetical protein